MGFVQGVKMQTRNAGFNEVSTLLGGIVDPELHCGFIVIGHQIQFGLQVGRNPGAAELGEPGNLGRAQNGDHARDDRDVDAQLAGDIVPEFIKVRVIKK